ncbi:MAG TPA: hypothetical protein VGE41_04525 [Verrucomicrobiae bacterium]
MSRSALVKGFLKLYAWFDVAGTAMHALALKDVSASLVVSDKEHCCWCRKAAQQIGRIDEEQKEQAHLGSMLLAL